MLPPSQAERDSESTLYPSEAGDDFGIEFEDAWFWEPEPDAHPYELLTIRVRNVGRGAQFKACIGDDVDGVSGQPTGTNKYGAGTNLAWEESPSDSVNHIAGGQMGTLRVARNWPGQRLIHFHIPPNYRLGMPLSTESGEMGFPLWVIDVERDQAARAYVRISFDDTGRATASIDPIDDSSVEVGQ